MTEPTNPLFEDEKEFLERKKLEYERALRGDVAEIKATTVQAGKVAAIGAGLVGSVWLITKALSGGKPKKKKKDRHSFDDYAGFDSFDDDAWETDDWVPSFQGADHEQNDYHVDSSDGFYFDGPDANLDDNGLGQTPDFPPHSAPHHGFDGSADKSSDFEQSDYDSAEARHSLPFDDSRRLPHADGFTEPKDEEDEQSGDDFEADQKKKKSKGVIGPALLAFVKSETGRFIAAQAAGMALALVTKTVQDILPSDEDKDKTGKNADLAPSSAPKGVPPATWPATSAVQDVSAAAHSDDNPTSPREPLA